MIFNALLQRRRQSSLLHSRKPLRRTQRPRLELLEDRYLLTVGTPTWLQQGPTAIANISAGGLSAAGAVQAVAIDPGNANRAFATAVDGGVWSTTNATSAAPTWTPLTDTQPFLGTTDIAFDPTDPMRNTLWVGTGQFSNNGIQNGPTVGLYRTTTGGTSWSVVGKDTFQGLSVSNVIPTALLDPTTQKQVVLVSTQATPFAGASARVDNPGAAGVYRSPDGGQTWALISGGLQANGNPTGLPAGDVWQMIADPANANRFYAGVTQAGQKGGIFVTNNGGLTWSEVAGDALLTNSPLTSVSGIKLAVHNDPNNNVLYAGVVNTRGDLSAVLRSTTQGGVWTTMDLPGNPIKSVNPGDQGPGNDDLVADPVSPTVVFVAGDQGFLFRGDASQTAGSTPTMQWTSITGVNANSTAPHADSRSMLFDPSGNLIETDDGGIYRLSTPNVAATRTWTFLSATMAVNAATFVAYDSVNHTVFGGSQDNGSPVQNAPGSSLTTDASSGDGQVAQADNVSQPGFSIHYTTAQELFFIRTVYNGVNNPITPLPLASAAFPALTVTGTGKPIGQLEKAPFTTQYAVDAAGGNRVLLGTRFLYESLDGGATFTSLGGLTADSKPKGDVGAVRALAYGGRLNGQNNADVAYVGTDGTGTDIQGRLLLRSQAGGPFAVLSNYPGSTPIQIVLDPDNWKTGYIVDNNNRIWRMTNAGASAGDFVNITGNLASLGLTILRTVAIYPNTSAPNDEVVFVGGYNGAVAATDNATLGANTRWTAFGQGLPNVMVTGLVYDPTDNVLAASTYGRGFWEVQGLSNVAGHAAPVVKLNAPAGNGNNFSATFTAGGGAVNVTDPGVTVTAAASPTLTGATIALANPLDGAAEVLTADTTGTNLTAVAYSTASGQLILSGTDTLANYQKVLATVKYNNTAAIPSNNPRLVNVVVNDGAATNRATTTIQIVGGANAPQVAAADNGNGNAAATVRSGVATRIAATVQVKAGASSTLVGATVAIADLLDAPNELLSVTTTGTAITASYNPTTGVLTLSGTDTIAHYQQVLDTLTYEDQADLPTSQPRTIRIVLNDGTRSSLAAALVVDVEPTNHAPVVRSGAVLTLMPVNQNDASNVGTAVSDLLDGAAAETIADPDPNAQRGIAVIGVDNRHGLWQFTTDGGDTWDSLQAASPTQAILLTDYEGTRVRFVPNAGFSGTVANGLTFRAWDQSGAEPGVSVPDANGSFADTTQNGGSTPFSTTAAQAAITVTPINQPPSFQLRSSLTVAATAGPQTIPGWATNLMPGGLGGSGAKLTFQVSNNNNSFFTVQPALDASGTLTFTPAIATSGGTATITVVAQNDAGTANGGRNTSAPQTFTITLTPVAASAQWLAQTYLDLLHRPLDASGQTFWSNQLANGVSRAQVALALEQTAEYRTQVELQQLYQRFLGRSGDAAGLAAWQQVLNQGTSLTQVESAFLGSPEYSQRHGGTTTGFLTAVYQDVLGRTIDSSGQTAWTNQLAAGMPHTNVALAILQSTEGFTDALNGLYSSLLHRSADAGGLAAFLAQLQQGVSLDTIQALMVGSPEYLSTHTTPAS